MNRQDPVYLDHAATTPISVPALAALTQELSRSTNPSSLHGSGRRARMVVEDARETIARAAGAHPSHVIFTSGGTESDNLAVKGLWWSRLAEDPARRVILCSAIEHHAVQDAVEWLESHEGAEVTWLPVDAEGRIDLEAYRQALAEHAGRINFATLMWANNEVGTIQPIAEFTALAAAHGVPVHSDAVQAFGQIPVDFAASGLATMAISAHKIGGPVGIGALLVDRAVKLTPTQHGGGQERDLRSGTLDAPAAAAFAVAAGEVSANLEGEHRRLTSLRDELIAGVLERVPDARLSGPNPLAPKMYDGDARLPANAHFTFPGTEGDSLLFLLDAAGVESSTGSACTAGVPRPSHVLLAMGMSEEQARGAQRFTLGHSSTREDVAALLDVLPEAYERARKAGMAGHESRIQTAATVARSRAS